MPNDRPYGEGWEPTTVMYGPEKSDPSIVPLKPANKAVKAAAELMEGRDGAEGNAGRQSTVRRAGQPCPRRRPAYETPSTGTARRS